VLVLRQGAMSPEPVAERRLPIVLSPSQGLPGDPVLVNGADPSSPTLFQIWALPRC
jgi:hypothetical protein